MQASTQTTNTVSNSVVAARPQPAVKRTTTDVFQLHRVNLKTLIEQQGSRIVSVDYEKLDGEARTLTGRLGVKAHLKGGSNNVERAQRPYLTMFDLQLKEYRTVNLATVTEVRCGGCIYRVVD